LQELPPARELFVGEVVRLNHADVDGRRRRANGDHPRGRFLALGSAGAVQDVLTRPEVCVNIWCMLDEALGLYRVVARAYALGGSDADKRQTLK